MKSSNMPEEQEKSKAFSGEKNHSKKRLLIASDSFLPRWDGVARFLSEIIPVLSDEYDITVLAPRFEGEQPQFKNVKIITFPLLKIKVADTYSSIPKIREIKDTVKEADIVWTHTLEAIGGVTILYAHKYKKPLIAYVHSFEGELARKAIKNIPLRNLLYLLYRTSGVYLYNKCNLLLIPYKGIGKRLSQIKVQSRKRIVHLGVDTNRFIPPEDKASAKLRIGLKPDTKVIGFNGRIGREKDLMTLYKAFERIKKNYPNLILLVIGGGIKEQKRVLKRDENIKLLGPVDNVVPYLQAMDIYVLPSLTETSSLSTMEAMSCSVPVIVTKVGYLKEYIKNKVNGFFFPMKNDYVLSIRLENLLKDDALRERIGYQARKTIKERFPWEKTVKEIKEVLRGF